MRDVQNPIATALDHLELVIKAFHKPTRVPVNKVIRDVVEPILFTTVHFFLLNGDMEFSTGHFLTSK